VIQLTRLNNEPAHRELRPDQNSWRGHTIQCSPLISGEKIVVRERVEQVIERVIQFRRAVLTGLPMMMAAANPTGPAEPGGKVTAGTSQKGRDVRVRTMDKSSSEDCSWLSPGLWPGCSSRAASWDKSFSPRQP